MKFISLLYILIILLPLSFLAIIAFLVGAYLVIINFGPSFDCMVGSLLTSLGLGGVVSILQSIDKHLKDS
jgi:hypothetical protein